MTSYLRISFFIDKNTERMGVFDREFLRTSRFLSWITLSVEKLLHAKNHETLVFHAFRCLILPWFEFTVFSNAGWPSPVSNSRPLGDFLFHSLVAQAKRPLSETVLLTGHTIFLLRNKNILYLILKSHLIYIPVFKTVRLRELIFDKLTPPYSQHDV